VTGRVTAVVAIALSSAVVGSASAADLVRPVTILSGHRPCEANLAVDPRDPRDLDVVARDESRDGLVRLRAWRSLDGGRRFRASWIVDGRVAGDRGEASDPVAVYDNKGAPAPAYLALRYGPTTWDSRIVFGTRPVIVSEHAPPFPTLSEDLGTRPWHDKPWATVDRRDGRAYVAWTQRDDTDTMPVAHIMVASALTGEQFGEPVAVARGGTGAQLAVRPDGTVVVAWVDKPNLSTQGRIRAARSTDHGATWSAPATVAAISIEDELSLPTLATDARGRLALCWQEARRIGAGRVACSRSTDGRAWSRRRYVTPAVSRQPAVAATGNGRFWLLVYRYEPDRTRVELWRSCDAARHWRRAAVLARRPFGQSPIFIGDYQGLAATARTVYAAFVLPRRPRGGAMQLLFSAPAGTGA
jgi:hypothetical protein